MDKHFSIGNDGTAISVDERSCGKYLQRIISIGSSNGSQKDIVFVNCRVLVN
ncbi:MAG: hypothetical protein HYV29_15310 [Ignavibacteriales bacterium]|nr:hypothetical protein [Ignavibacteriales bacterium]